MNYSIYQLDPLLKKLFFMIVLTLSVGVLCGLGYLYHTTNMTAKGTVVRFNGSQPLASDDEFDIPTEYPKPLGELLLTTHTHILSFSLIFTVMGVLFYGSTLIHGKWKLLLITEPFVSTLLTFGSLWGVRFVSANFVYVTIISATLMYMSFFIMATAIIAELLFKKQST
ncbi:MAG: hypothetical protein HQK83_12805 [Fibrobacteria bacterium]|nr:hypothetical protein [Fibrobacteria bacterium]